MNIASFDPGERTGLVIIDFSETLNNCSVLFHHTFSFKGICVVTANSYEINRVVLERPPDMASGVVIDVYNFLYETYKDKVAIIELLPGLWKPLAKANSWKWYLANSWHETDAYNMLRFYCLRSYGIDIGELS